MIDFRQVNFRDLTHRYLMGTPAAGADDLLRNLGLPGIQALLQHHSGKPRNPSEREHRNREVFDALLAFYGLVEIGCLADVLPRPLPDSFTARALDHLTHPALRRYFEESYPRALPYLLRRRLEEPLGKQPTVDRDDESASALFSDFLEVNSLVENHEAAMLLRSLEERDRRARRTFRAIRLPWRFALAVAKPPAWRNDIDRAIDGFRSVLGFCLSFVSLLRRASSLPALRSAMWHHHGYLAGEGGRNLLGVVAAFESSACTKTGPATDAVRELIWPENGLAVEEIAGRQFSREAFVGRLAGISRPGGARSDRPRPRAAASVWVASELRSASPQEPAAIEVHDLTKRYGRTTAVDRISFKVQRREIVGFLGPNGAGKTTTMRILACYLPPTEGTARVTGRDVLDQALEIKRRVGYLPETPPLYPDMEVGAFLEFCAKIKGVPSRARKGRIDDAIEKTRLGDVRRRLIGRLSKGFRQRVGLAQAILHDPDVLILDEPTAGLDPKQIIETRELIKGLAGEHTILLSTHILPEVEMTCSRALIINRGKIVADGTLDNLTRRLHGAGQLTVEVRGSASLVAALIKEVRGVRLGRVAEEHAGIVRLEVDAEPGMDVRAEIARAVIEHGLDLVGLQSVGTVLEDAYLHLTVAEAAGDGDAVAFAVTAATS